MQQHVFLQILVPFARKRAKLTRKRPVPGMVLHVSPKRRQLRARKRANFASIRLQPCMSSPMINQDSVTFTRKRTRLATKRFLARVHKAMVA